MSTIEEATREELESLPDSALTAVALDLARRLDDGPADSVAVLLARELRMALADLHQRGQEDPTSDVDAFLARIAAPDSRDPAH
jgi:uncharacterized protein (DUF2267 family)